MTSIPTSKRMLVVIRAPLEVLLGHHRLRLEVILGWMKLSTQALNNNSGSPVVVEAGITFQIETQLLEDRC